MKTFMLQFLNEHKCTFSILRSFCRLSVAYFNVGYCAYKLLCTRIIMSTKIYAINKYFCRKFSVKRIFYLLHKST